MSGNGAGRGDGSPSGGGVVNATIRLSRSNDDPALVSLSARSPMQAPLTICIERSPSFFALRDLRGPSRTLVAERDGMVVGCVSVTTRRVLWNGEPREVDYVADLKVPPAERRSGIGRALVEATLRDARRMLVWTGAVGNDALSGVLRSTGLGSAPLATFSALQLLPFFVGSRTPDDVARACPSDEDELRALLDTAFRRRRLAPALDSTTGLGGIPLDGHLVLRRAGRIVAALATWEGSSVKQTRVVRMTRALRLLQRATTLLPGAPALPPEGSLLRFHCVRNAVCRDDAVDALAVLSRAALREASGRGDHFLLFGCDERDPFAGAVARMPRLTYRYELRAWHPHEPVEASSTKPQTLYFDDPALS